MREVSIKNVIDSSLEPLASEYIELLVARVTHSSMSLEEDLGNVDDSQNAIKFRDGMKAFKYLLNQLYTFGKLTEETIVKVADMVNESSLYISRGYRRIESDYLYGTNIPIARIDDIPKKMSSLLELYGQYPVETDADIFAREAAFHIQFIKIHPFEDGNGRTARLLTNYNLIREGRAPVVITSDLMEYYQSYIKNDDVLGMANLLSIQSRKEQEVINILVATALEEKEQGNVVADVNVDFEQDVNAVK